MSFAELRERRDSLAGSFSRLGIGEGTRVATFLGEGWEHVTAIYVQNNNPGGYWEDQGYNWFSGL